MADTIAQAILAGLHEPIRWCSDEVAACWINQQVLFFDPKRQ